MGLERKDVILCMIDLIDLNLGKELFLRVTLTSPEWLTNK